MHKPLFTSKALRCLVIVFVSVLAVAMAGCDGDSSGQYKYGVASKKLFAAQVANPAAPNDRSPVDGMPGAISEKMFSERYLNKFAEDEDESGNFDSD